MEFAEMANAVITQAIADYERYCRELNRLSETDEHEARKRFVQSEMLRIDKFFRSDWCNSLSQADILSMWKKKKREIEEQAELVRKMKGEQG